MNLDREFVRKQTEHPLLHKERVLLGRTQRPGQGFFRFQPSEGGKILK